MPLHSRRRRLAELESREAAGESFWTETFSSSTRTRIEHLCTGLSSDWHHYVVKARMLILQDEGLRFLNAEDETAYYDFMGYLQACPDDMMPTVLEAIWEGFRDDELYEQTYQAHWDGFTTGVNEILQESRISWEFVEGEMTPFSSRELHVEVVEPTLRLLASSGWENVEAAYRKALKELAADDAPDAITDAGTALQLGLLLCGAEGNSLGSLIISAKRKGIIAGHDRPLFDVLERAASWVSADRSEIGDAHTISSAKREDAWLAVHIVGALLLRLSASTERPTQISS